MHKTVRVREHSTMERIVRQVESQRGKTLLEDENYFQYASNGHGIHTNRWRCTKRSCSATVTTRKSTGRLTNTSDARRAFLSNSTGQDCRNNTGRKEKSLDNRAKIKFIIDAYDTMPKDDLIRMLAHTI